MDMRDKTDCLTAKRRSGLRHALAGIWEFYYDGFRSMTVGKTLWIIILVKLFIFFVVIKWLFFPNLLSRDFDNDEDRADHVRRELIRPRQNTLIVSAFRSIYLPPEWKIFASN